MILEEIAKYEDQPPFGAFERAMEVHFGPRGLGRRVLGTDESIRAMVGPDFDARRISTDAIVRRTSCWLPRATLTLMGLVAAGRDRQTASWASSDRCLVSSHGRCGHGQRPAGRDFAWIGTSTIADAQSGLSWFESLPGRASRQRGSVCGAGSWAAILGDEGGSRLFWELIDTGRAEVATVWPHEFHRFRRLVHLHGLCAPEDVAARIRALLVDDPPYDGRPKKASKEDELGSGGRIRRQQDASCNPNVRETDCLDWEAVGSPAASTSAPTRCWTVFEHWTATPFRQQQSTT